MNENIKNLIVAGESYRVEFKRSLDKSFIEEACAFANSGGGQILLGVADNGAITGIDTGNVMRSRVQDMLGQLEPKLDCSVEVEKNILIAHIPEGAEKPYGCARGFFMRMGANSQKLTRDGIINFFKQEGRIRFDELTNKKAKFDTDFDPRAFSHFLELAGISRTIDQNALLKNLDCLTDDNKFTNAGVLFFTKDIDFLLNHAIVVCVLYKGDKKVHILDKKDFKGNLAENIDNALLFVQRHTNVEYKIEHLQREEITDYPKVALREAITNAVCHRDYFNKSANVLIEVFENRVVISNPGGLPSGLKPEDFGTRSVTRNPLIASLLHRIDFIEKVGTGIGRIKQEVEKHGGCTVEINYDTFYTITFLTKASVKEKSSQSTPSTTEVATEVTTEVTMEVKSLLKACHGELSRAELQQILSIKNKEYFRNAYITPSLKCNAITMTRPDKPNSRFQKYRLTDKGQQLIKNEASDSKISAFKGNKPKNSGETAEKSSIETVGQTVEEQKTSEKIVDLMNSNPHITIDELAIETGVSTRTIERNIGKLQTNGVIQREGSRKDGKWLISRLSE